MSNISAINPATGLPYPAGGAVPGSPQAPNPEYQPGGSCNYPYGQCTYGVALKYPVFFKMACMGNGCQWWGNAQARGWYTSSKPYVGSVVCYACNLPGSGGDGHVAVVTQVDPDGTFWVYEWNWEVGDGPDPSPRHVTSMAYVQGFFSPPGAAGPTTGNTATAAPATGARGLACQYPVKIPSVQIAGQSVGGWNICMDGLIGVLAIGGGIAIMALAAFVAVKPRAERAAGAVTRDVGIATAQPEVAAASLAASPAAQEVQQRQRRSPTANHLSVQEQETRRHLMATGYSSVQATRGAQMAGSKGTATERLAAGLRALGSDVRQFSPGAAR